jgi:hypothetical protein
MSRLSRFIALLLAGFSTSVGATVIISPGDEADASLNVAVVVALAAGLSPAVALGFFQYLPDLLVCHLLELAVE